MRAVILGVGDAFTRLHFGSSALLDGPDGFVLLDCPDLVHRAIREATARVGWRVDASAIDDIIITHLHDAICNIQCGQSAVWIPSGRERFFQ